MIGGVSHGRYITRSYIVFGGGLEAIEILLEQACTSVFVASRVIYRRIHQYSSGGSISSDIPNVHVDSYSCINRR